MPTWAARDWCETTSNNVFEDSCVERILYCKIEVLTMRELASEIIIESSLEKVWNVLIDGEHYREWNPFIRHIKGEIKQGKRIKVVIVQPPDNKELDFVPRLITVKPPYEIRWQGHFIIPGIFDGEHEFKLEQLSTNSIRFVQKEKYKGFLAPFIWPLLDINTRAGFEAMNKALKERMEKIF